MKELNGCEPRKIKVLGMVNFWFYSIFFLANFNFVQKPVAKIKVDAMIRTEKQVDSMIRTEVFLT